MIALRADLKVVVAFHPIAFRRGGAFTALSRWWPRRRNPQSAPYCADVFMFGSKRKDRLLLAGRHHLAADHGRESRAQPRTDGGSGGGPGLDEGGIHAGQTPDKSGLRLL
jgi:hypothetical protein